MSEFNYARLDLARRLRGLNKGELARALGMSARSLHAHGSGKATPTRFTLESMGRVLNVPPEFFVGPDLEEPPVDGSSFRAMTRVTQRLKDRAIAAGALALALADWIDDRFTLPVPSVPMHLGVPAEAAAMAVRSEWGLGERPIPNIIHLLEAHGVRVFSLAEDCVTLDAYSFWRNDTPCVFLNTMKSAEHSRFDAAHELGHLVMHPSGTQHRLSEYEANRFASTFLMPEGDIKAQAPRFASVDDIVRAKARWTVSAVALAYRLHVVHLLTDWQYRAILIEMSKRGYRKNEPNPARPERSQILDKVFAQLRSERVTHADVARALQLPAADLAKAVFGLVLTSVEGTAAAPEQSPPLRPTLRIV